MINYRRISYIHIFYNCNFGIDGEEKHERAEFIFRFLLSTSSLLYLISPKISITISPSPPVSLHAVVFRRKSGVAHSRRPLFRPFLLSLKPCTLPSAGIKRGSTVESRTRPLVLFAALYTCLCSPCRPPFSPPPSAESNPP